MRGGKGMAKGPRPPLIEMLFQIFRLNFRGNMYINKICCFSNKFSKIKSAGGFPPPSAP